MRIVGEGEGSSLRVSAELGFWQPAKRMASTNIVKGTFMDNLFRKLACISIIESLTKLGKSSNSSID